MSDSVPCACKVPLPEECPHCKFLRETFLTEEDSTDREYWLMTEVFVYLHGTDVCDGKAQIEE